MSVKLKIAEADGIYFITITCFIKQKLNYIHFNPFTGKWNLADMPENYAHSSAAFYGNDIQGIFPVDIMDIMEIDLNKRI